MRHSEELYLKYEQLCIQANQRKDAIMYNYIMDMADETRVATALQVRAEAECEKYQLCNNCFSEYLTEEFGGCGECLSC